MKIAILYDSATGRTAAAARGMAEILGDHGHECTVSELCTADPAAIAAADLVCTGCWTHGLFIILQHPTREWVEFVERADGLSGKKVVVFCTYRLATGKTLNTMSRAVEQRGGEVVGTFKFRAPEPDAAFARFATGL